MYIQGANSFSDLGAAPAFARLSNETGCSLTLAPLKPRVSELQPAGQIQP